MQGILVAEHNGNLIHQDGEKFYVYTSKGDLIGTSNCLNGAQIVSCLGKKGLKDIFKKEKRK